MFIYMNNKLHRKCPRCKRKRTWTVPSDHMFSAGHEWDKRDGVYVCYWCIARETPDGETKLRAEQKALRAHRKMVRKIGWEAWIILKQKQYTESQT